MFKASELVAFVLAMLGMPYWYGTCVYRCTESTLKSKTKQYPEHYASGRMPRYRSDIAKRKICMDCVGMIKGFFWTNGGKDVIRYINGEVDAYKNKYASNGCPDKSANGMLEYCQKQGCKWGTIGSIPDVPGILVFFPGHVGVYIGNGYVVEARGFAYGVVKTKLSARGWKHWAYLPDHLIAYDGVEADSGGSDAGVVNPPQDDQTAVCGAVMTWQKAAIADGFKFPKFGADGEWGAECEAVARQAIVKKRTTYKYPNLTKIVQAAVGVTVDGKCGSDTDRAIKAYQQKHGLLADGIVGLNTWNVILKG